MKSVLINIGILLGIGIAYYIDFFGWFVGRGMKFFSLGLVVIMFVIAWKVLGNPFKEDKKNGDDK